MGPVLIVEDNKVTGMLLKRRVQREFLVPVYWVQSQEETLKLFSGDCPEFSVALVDLHLPDAPAGEIVDVVMSRKIPTIIFTGDISDEVQDMAWARNVVDYVLKEDPSQIDYVMFLIHRLERNRQTKVLFVDDSSTARMMVSNLLRVHQYQVFLAACGEEALETMRMNPDIRIVITDYNMPNMNGFELTRNLRAKYTKDRLAIIGVSASGSPRVVARFIKSGANDFIDKPFTSEQFYCRVTQTAEMLDQFELIAEASKRDYLTGLHNRRALFDLGQALLANAKRSNLGLAVAMLDLDYFKEVNDTYGHDAGDFLLKNVAALIKSHFRESDIVCRFGGEEFCVLACDMDPAQIVRIFEALRQEIEEKEFYFSGATLRVTVSIGICPEVCTTLDQMIKVADTLLYEAKRAGRNRVNM